MFWNKKAKANESADLKPEKLPKPKEILDILARYVVTECNGEPDLVWRLKNVLRPRGVNGTFDFRIFDSTQTIEAKVAVKDYTSLDGHPELILYEGWFDKNSGHIDIDKSQAEAA
ncbi:hypothetical protein ACFLU4_04950 [Chloroflexota bacterium]